MSTKKLTEQEKKKLETAILNVWHYIASDAYQLMEGKSTKECEAIAAEMVVDAGRLVDIGGISDELYQSLLGKDILFPFAKKVLKGNV